MLGKQRKLRITRKMSREKDDEYKGEVGGGRRRGEERGKGKEGKNLIIHYPK